MYSNYSGIVLGLVVDIEMEVEVVVVVIVLEWKQACWYNDWETTSLWEDVLNHWGGNSLSCYKSQTLASSGIYGPHNGRLSYGTA